MNSTNNTPMDQPRHNQSRDNQSRDNQSRDNQPQENGAIATAVRSAFDEMFAEAGIDDHPPELTRGVVSGHAANDSRQMLWLRAAAIVVVVAAGVAMYVAFRGGPEVTTSPAATTPGSGPASQPSNGPGGTNQATDPQVPPTYPPNTEMLNTALSGTLEVESGCVVLNRDGGARQLAILENGSTVVDNALRTPDGALIPSGTAVTGSGEGISWESAVDQGVSEPAIKRCVEVVDLQPLSGVDVPTVQIYNVQPASAVNGSQPQSSSPGSSAAPTNPSATPAPATSAPATTTPQADARPTPPTTAWVQVGGSLVNYDVASGSEVGRIDRWADDGLYWGSLHIAADAGTAYVSETIEDSWYSCDTIAGSVMSMPWPVDGSPVASNVADGGSRALGVSPDGKTLYYDLATNCSPDPDNASWFVARHDSLRLVDIASGQERTVSTQALASGSGDDILDATMTPTGELVVLLSSGSVYRLQPADGAVIERDGAQIGTVGAIATGPDAPLQPARLLSSDATSITVVLGDESGAYVVRRISIGDGSSTDLATAGYVPISDDGYGNVLITTTPDSPVTATPGESVTVLTVTTPDGMLLGSASW